MLSGNISKVLIGRSRKFLEPYLALMDAWRRDFIPELFNGMIRSGGLVVTEMARELRRPGEAMEAVWQRLRRHIGSEEWRKYEDRVREKFARDRVEGIHAWTPIVVDLSDLSKPHSRKLEFLATVRDADESSLRGGTILNPGYWVFESYVPLGREGDPLPVVCFPFSVEDPRIGSHNRALDQGFDRLRQAAQGKGIVVMDRGFDGDVVFGLLEAKRMRFLCRLVGNRTLLDPDRESLGLAEAVAARTLMTHEAPVEIWKDHRWQRRTLRLGWRPVRLPDTGELYTLLVVSDTRNDEGRLLLLTNVPVRSVVEALKLVRCYFLRWRAEDAIRMIKRELGLETVRVFDFASIRRLVEFGFWILALVTLVTTDLTEAQKDLLTRASGAWQTPVLLFHYRVFALLRIVLARHGPGFLSQPASSGAEV